jgi:serine protease Do
MAEQLSQSVVEVRSDGSGSGAGTIWRAGGVVVTNDHVVSRDRAAVTLRDGRTLPASLVARDRRNDLAILHVEATELPAAPLGDARRLRPGELVLAVGHPFGVRRALTIGVVHSALPGRARREGRELLYADVLLGPGNSGGPLADARGRVVGINAMVSNGLALAVPSHAVERLLGAGTPVLGIGVRDVALTPRQAQRASERFGVPGGAGILVLEVEPGSAAEEAGLLFGDVLVELGDEPLHAAAVLPDLLAEHASVPLRLGVLRGERALEITATLRAAAAVQRAA